VLTVGIGGGGDVVGALAVHATARAAGIPSSVGGLTWERRPVDPLPGPRHLRELTGVRPLHAATALATGRTRGPGDVQFAEGRVAALLGEPTVLVDPNPGTAAVADGIAAAAAALGADTVVLLDIGGDVLAHGTEPGLASPLADAVLLAAAPRLAETHGLRVVGAVFGAGCDGELTPAEVSMRLAEVAAAGGDLGHIVPDTAALTLLEQACATVPTEASALALRCAKGHIGRVPIRGGRRHVELTPAGGVIACFDPAAALRSAARLAALVGGAPDLEAANALLTSRGVSTELAFERAAAADGPRGGR
jgi:hypothetical protein